MKTTVTLEFGADELEDFVVKTLAKGVYRLVGSQNPAVGAAVGAIQQGLMAIITAGARPQARGYPYGPQVGGGLGGFGPPPGPGPWPYGPPPGPYGAAAPGTNVRPIREPGAMEHCIPIDESRLMEAGWACCGCGTFNGVQRDVCRQCKHPCCAATPSPSPQSPTPEPS